MIKKIIIDNFMAHEHSELELGEGVTILTGANNTGKSAVVEALRCLATNPTPNHFIRHGAKEARVSVELTDGTKVVWVRTKRWAMYELWHPGAEEPEEYHKLQRKVPEDIQKILRMDLVDLETNKSVDIHIGNQREPVFLLNQPPSDTAAFFAASTESAHLLAMQNLLKRQTTDGKRQADDLEGQIDRIENEIDKLEQLPALEMGIEETRVLEDQATRLEGEIPVLQALLDRDQTLSGALEIRKSSVEVLEQVRMPPQLQDIGGLTEILGSVAGVTLHLEGAERISATLKNLSVPPEAADTTSLARLVAEIRSTEHILQKVAVQDSILGVLESAPGQDNTKELAEFLDEFVALNYRFTRTDRWSDILQEVAEPPVLESEHTLHSLLIGMQDLEARKRTQEGALADMDTGLQKIVDAMDTHIRELGHCPTCGNRLTTETFLDHGRCHDA